MAKALMVFKVQDGAAISSGRETTPWGASFTTTNETNARAQATEGATFSRLQGRVTSGGSGVNSIRFRKNGADGNLLANGTGTGLHQDTSNTDVLSGGDEFNLAYTDTGTDPVWAWVACNVEFASGHGNFHGSANFSPPVYDVDNATRYLLVSGSQGTDGESNETRVQWRNRGYTSWEALQVRVVTNDRTSSSTVRNRINGAFGSLSCSIGVGVTGLIVDTSPADALASGDLINYALTLGTGAGENLNITFIGATFKSSTGKSETMGGIQSGAARAASGTAGFCPIGGAIGEGLLSTDGDARITVGFAARVSNLRCYLASNTYASNGTLRLFKEGGAVLTLTLGAGGGEGWYENTTDTADITDSDRLSFELSGGGASGSINIRSLGFTFSPLSTPTVVDAPTRSHSYTANVPTLLFSNFVAPPAATAEYALHGDVDTGEKLVQALAVEHAYSPAAPVITGPLSVSAPSVGVTHLGRAPRARSPEAEFAFWLDTPNAERRWLLELEAFPLAAIPQGMAMHYAGPSFSQLAFSEGAGSQEAAVTTLYYADHGWTSVVFSEVSGFWLDLGGAADHGTPALEGFDFVNDTKIGDRDLGVLRAGVATRWRLAQRHYALMRGQAGANPRTPDNAANSITGDIRLRAFVAPTSWASGATQCLIAKWGASGQRSYKLLLTGSGNLRIEWSPDGTTTLGATSTATVNLAGGAQRYVGAWLDVNNQSGSWTAGFETSADGVTWAALGTDVVGASGGAGSSIILGIYDSDRSAGIAPLETWFGGSRKFELFEEFCNKFPADQDGWNRLQGVGHHFQWASFIQSRPFFTIDIALPMTLAATSGSAEPAPADSLQNIALGARDSVWRSLARSWFDNGLGGTPGKPVYLRPGWEMSGSWYPHRAPPGSANATQGHFAAAFRRIVDVMRSERPNNNWKFGICPVPNSGANTTWLNQVWPGNTHCSWVGVDAYDMWLSGYPMPSSATTPAQRQPYWNQAWADLLGKLNIFRNFAQSKGVPLTFPEYSTVNATHNNCGYDNTYYVQQMYNYCNDPSNNVLWHSWLNGDPDANNRHKIEPPTTMPNASALYRSLWNVATASPTTTSIFNSTSPVEIGGAQAGTVELFTGKAFYAEARNGLATVGSPVFAFDANDGTPAQTQFASRVTGETWTLNGACTIVGAEIETVAPNAQRSNRHPVTLARRGLLVEKGREQLALHTADFANAWWKKQQGATVAAATHPAPDGTFTAASVTDANNAGFSNIETQDIPLPGGTNPVVASVYIAKDNVGRATRFGLLQIKFKDSLGALVGRLDMAFDSATGERAAFNTLFGADSFISKHDITDAGAFWRVWLSGHCTHANAAQCSAALYPAHGASANMSAAAITGGAAAQGTMLAWGFNVSHGSRPTSYIPAAGATVTRGSDLAELVGIAGGAEGTLYVEAEQEDTTASGYMAVLRDAGGSDRIGARQIGDKTVFEVIDNGAVQASLEVIPGAVNDIITQASADKPFSGQTGVALQALGTSRALTTVAESGLHGSVLPNGETIRFGKVDDPAGGAFQALAFQVVSSDPTTSDGKRVEILSSPSNLVYDQVYWIAFQCYVFDWGTLASNDTALFGAQVHTGSSETVGGPSISLITEQSATGREFHVKARWSPGPAGQFAANAVVTRYTKYPIPFGQWTNFVMKFRHNTGNVNRGFLQVWMNGQQIANHVGDLGYNTGFADYTKFGYYNFGTMNSTPRKVLERYPTVVHDPTGNAYTLAQMEALLSAGGLSQASSIVRVSGGYKADDFAANANGQVYGVNDQALVDVSGTVPTVDRLTIGSDAGDNYLDGHVRRVYRLGKRVLNGTHQRLASEGPKFSQQGGGGVPGVDPDSAIYYDGRMMGDFDIERRITGRDGIGGTAVVLASGSLNNQDGALDAVTNDYSIVGRAARLYVGQPHEVRENFTLVMSGVVEKVWVEQQVMRLRFSDGVARLERMLNLTTYAGTGGLEGGADLKGKYRPKAYGKTFNVSTPLVNSASLIYQASMGAINDVPAVYDRGISLTKGADYSSQSDMESNAPSAGQFRVWKGGGYFRLGSTPAGTVTCDIEGDALGGSYITKAGAIVKRILEEQAQLSAGEIHAASFTTLDATVVAPVGIWIGTEGGTIARAVDDLLAAVGAFGGFSRLGQFKVGRVTTPESPPLDEFSEEDIISIERLPLPPEVDPIAWRILVAYQRNYTVQTDFAAAVPAARRTFCAEPFRTEAAEDATQLSRHRLAREYANANLGLYRDQSDAADETKRLRRLWGVERSMFRIEVGARALTRDIGDVISIRHKRYRLHLGKPAVVIGHEIRGARVLLTVLL